MLYFLLAVKKLFESSSFSIRVFISVTGLSEFKVRGLGRVCHCVSLFPKSKRKEGRKEGNITGSLRKCSPLIRCSSVKILSPDN